MIVPIPVVRETLTVQTENLRFYECRFCGFEDKVVVGAVGQVISDSYGYGAESRARDIAQSDENDVLRLCPCPMCGRRNSLEFVVRGILSVLGIAIASALLPAAVGVLLWGTRDFEMMVGIMSFLPVFMMAYAYWRLRVRWVNAGRSVWFGARGSLASTGSASPRRRR